MNEGWLKEFQERVYKHQADCNVVRTGLNDILEEIGDIYPVNAEEGNPRPSSWTVLVGPYRESFDLATLREYREGLARAEFHDIRRIDDVPIKDAIIAWFMDTFKFV